MQIPSLNGATGWLNSEPLDPQALRGRVVLVNFWTLTCINWLRQEPWVRAWSHAYRDDGLVVLGVHTPEFGFEHDIEQVRLAVAARGIEYPVATDNDYAVWSAFDNHYWPALYFVDRDGIIRDSHFGEGRYEESERVLQDLLGIERELTQVEPAGVELQADWDHLGTPETYLGAARGERRGGMPPQLNEWALEGDWTRGDERVVLEKAPGSIAFRFHARDAHLVMNGPGEIAFRVRLDGEAPGEAHGLDVDATGAGVLREGRMYQLIRQHPPRERTLSIEFEAPGAQAYSFTFG
jgi:hypothetical protein